MRLVKKNAGIALLTRVKWCDSFLCRLRGLTLRGPLADGEGLVLVERRESRLDTAIHMFFVNFPIAVVWLDARYRVVDTCVALPWRPIYVPKAPAQYVLEAAPALLDHLSPGDELEFIS
ncbi:MAG: DUF192 domain-containing protein [Chloroflexi bacterium]|nr:DUF192 domain-containing protein [Chloroflexota bacterium]